MAMTADERKLRGRLYWTRRKDRMNARKRAKYFEATYPKRQARQREKEIEAEVYQAVPKERFKGKSDEEKKKFVLGIKSRPCEDCGGCFHSWAMEFDHRIPELKTFTIARMGHKGSYSLARIKEELAKCDVVCANCHRTRHARRKQGLPATLPPPEYHI